MSFGWSVGDIAAAVSLVYNLIEALDTCDGAAGDYRKAVAFLHDLKQTLEPLHAFTAWNTYPTYGKQVEEQAAQIKEPIESFLKDVLKFEPSLGAKAKEGHHRHVLRKWQWRVVMSKKVLALRKKIDAHMRVIDTLLQRLTLDVVYATQQKLPEHLRAAFEGMLRPELIGLLRENLLPLHTKLLEDCRRNQILCHDELVGKISSHYQDFSANIEAVKRLLCNPGFIKTQVRAALVNQNPSIGVNSIQGSNSLQAKGGDETHESGRHIHKNLDDRQANSRQGMKQVPESLREVYYLVFLYLGHFLKNLLLTLSQWVQQSRALTPILDPRSNILFLDAIGRIPRVLPYEFFRSFNIMQTFIRDEFRDLPGSSWVERGRYQIMSMVNNRPLNKDNWSRSVTPGSKVVMSMVVWKLLESDGIGMDHCPQNTCPGKWIKPQTPSWATCPVCSKEVFTSPVAISALKQSQSQSHESREASYSENTSKSYRDPLSSVSSRTGGINTLPVTSNEDEDEVALFKRIVQETSRAAPPETRFHQSINAPSTASPRPSGSSSQSLDPSHRSKSRASTCNWSAASLDCAFSITTSLKSTSHRIVTHSPNITPSWSNLIISDEACDGSNPSDRLDDSSSPHGSEIHLASSLNDPILEHFASRVESNLIRERNTLHVNSELAGLLSTPTSSSDEPTESADSLIELELQGDDAELETPATSEASPDADIIFCPDGDDYNEDPRAPRRSRDILLGLTLEFPRMDRDPRLRASRDSDNIFDEIEEFLTDTNFQFVQDAAPWYPNVS